MKRKLSQKEPLISVALAAEQCGVSPAMLKKLEAGKLKGILRPLRIEDRSKLIRGYGPQDIAVVLEHYRKQGRINRHKQKD